MGKRKLFPKIRIVSLNPDYYFNSPLPCVCDFFKPCTCDLDIKLPKPRRYCPTVICSCDCAGDCLCDTYIKPPPCHCDPVHYCDCVSKGTFTPDSADLPDDCETHFQTFFRWVEHRDSEA